jgi:hypothetical protein
MSAASKPGIAAYPTPPNQRHGVKRITTRVRGLALWQPRQKTRDLLDKVRLVLHEYRQFLPLTIRQVHYRLVGAYGVDKTELAYKRLVEHANRARRAGMIPFLTIRDDGVVFNEPLAWDSPRELIETFLHNAETFRLDRQTGQSQWLVVALEAGGMVPQIERITDPFGIPVASGGGFDSLTSKHELAVRFGERPIKVEVLHIGDYDPSGVHVFTSLMEDVQALVRDLGKNTEITFTRLAVTPEQIDALRLPTAPPKEKDRRKFDDTRTVQAEAIPPDVLAQIVRDAINSRIDQAVLDEVLDHEQRFRNRLTDRLDHLLDEDWDDDPDDSDDDQGHVP